MRQMNLKEELEICNQHKKQGYCYWGACKHCGVPQFIEKLQTDKVEHDEKKHEVFRRIAKGLK